MTELEYEMPFAKWCKETKCEKIMLDQFGSFHWSEKRKAEITEKWHELWENERTAYRIKLKNELITNALLAIKNAGFRCRLCSYQNGHINAKSRRGTVFAFYATTGRIAGQNNGTEWGDENGLDELLRLLEKY